jgi:hypothetical protein
MVMLTITQQVFVISHTEEVKPEARERNAFFKPVSVNKSINNYTTERCARISAAWISVTCELTCLRQVSNYQHRKIHRLQQSFPNSWSADCKWSTSSFMVKSFYLCKNKHVICMVKPSYYFCFRSHGGTSVD